MEYQTYYACNEEHYKKGNVLAILPENDRLLNEQLCKQMNDDIEYNDKHLVTFDWHYRAGCCCIKYFGPKDLAKKLFLKHIKWYNLDMTLLYKNQGCHVEIKYGENDVK